MYISNDYFSLKGKNAEQLVHDLALKTFLTDWCYLNPTLPSGKELCDLLVVFDEVAIIWQIKDLKLNERGKYKESEVKKNLRQLSGARRQLFELKTSIELENPRRGKELFAATAIKEIYLISVLLGEGEEAFSFAEYIKNHTIHVFTREFTQIALQELDTISDFTKYLRTKEALIEENKQFIIFGGEEELLAHYLINNRSFEEFKKADLIILDQGSWEQIQNREEYKAKKKEDEISYGWDSIINRAHTGSSEYERVARELARPNRFERRYLSKVFFDAHMRADNDNKYDLFRRVLPMDDVTYCFLFADDPEPRERRVAMLSAICQIARVKSPENKKVIGIATEKKIRPTCSYDFCLVNIPELTEEYQEDMEKLQRETGILTNPIISYAHEDEYPKLEKD
jgi:hypothetical protein